MVYSWAIFTHSPADTAVWELSLQIRLSLNIIMSSGWGELRTGCCEQQLLLLSQPTCSLWYSFFFLHSVFLFLICTSIFNLEKEAPLLPRPAPLQSSLLAGARTARSGSCLGQYFQGVQEPCTLLDLGRLRLLEASSREQCKITSRTTAHRRGAEP